MAYYDKKLGVWLPKTAKEEKPTILEKPKKKKKIPKPEPPIQEPPEVVYVPPEPPKEEVMEEEIEKTQLLKDIVEIQKEDPIIELTPEEKIAIRRQTLKAKIAELEPYYHEVDEDGIDWWICNICKKAYNSETVQKRHQTLKHK